MARRQALSLVASLLVLLGAAPETSAEVYLTVKEAPGAVFPEADSFEREDIQVTEEFRRRLKKKVGRAKPSIWEPFYISFIAKRDGETIGYAVICEEIGKHRPITFIVGVTPAGKVKDVAVMMYRESVGSEVRYKGFLEQFQGKKLQDPIRPYRDIRNVSGATLSVRALSRGVRKALAVIQLAYLESREDP
ncbi:MAG: FMN-binding protein [Terriglobia bacterium]